MMAISAAHNFWREFNIQGFQRDLDAQATEIARRQDESDLARKKLVELSRDFKKNSSEEFRKKVAPLLKSFQNEVDALSKRSQAAETYFLSAYKKVLEIPDPTAVFEQAEVQQKKLVSAQDLEIENKKLRETLAEYNTEFAHVKNQEVTILRLKEQLREMDEKLEERTMARVQEREAEIVKAYKEKEREQEKVYSEAVARLEQANMKIATMETALQSTQTELFEIKNKFDEEGAARAAEIEILVTDLERSNQKAATAEKEVERQQHLHAERLSTSPHDKSSSEKVELELELQARDKEISKLLEDLKQLQSSLTKFRETSAVQVDSLERQLSEKTSELSVLRKKLAAQEDYQELKREINVMKMIEFATVTEDAVEGATPSKPLEVLLLEKNRSLQNENTSLKQEVSQLRECLSSLQLQRDETEQVVQEQKSLISELESHLSRVQPYLPVRTEGEGQSAPSSVEIMSEVLKGVQARDSGSVTKGNSSSTEESLLSIVTSQRERFKQRNVELETECHQQRQTISVLRQNVDSLRGDNVKLYEKIKFLQSYPGSRKPVDDRETMGRYSSQYEAQLDPFLAFNAKERQRKYMQLSGPDKATLVLGQFILSSKTARMVAFIYTILLHLLVFMVLFKLANTAACERDLYAECAKIFTEHMQIFHPENAEDMLKTFGAGEHG